MASSDFKRLLAAAADAALSDDQPSESLGRPSSRNGGSKAFRGLRGVAAGAVLVAAARAAAKRGPGPMSLVRHLPKPDLPDFSELTERARDLIDDWFPEDDSDEDFEEEDEDVDEDYDEPEAEAEEESEEAEEEPEGEEEEEPEGEEDEEPEAAADDEDFDDEELEDDEEPEDDDEDVEDEELEEDDEDYDVEPSERIDPPARPPRPPRRKKAKTG